jgi:hypothetical protein
MKYNLPGWTVIYHDVDKTIRHAVRAKIQFEII